MTPLSDDELDEFYRRVEARTAERFSRQRRPESVSISLPPIACPTPEKRSYADEADARRGIDRLREHTRRADTLRTYQCRCDAWHITSRPQIGRRRR